MNDSYTTHSSITNPGIYAQRLDGLPTDLAGIAQVTQGLVYHDTADQQFLGYAPPRERLPEIDTCMMERMLAQLPSLHRS